MDSASFQFVAFGLVVALLCNLRSTPVWRGTVLLLASLVFLGMLAHNLFLLIPLFGFLAFGYAGLRLMQAGKRTLLPTALIASILLYIWLKKYTFLPASSFLRVPYFTLGLSYIFFRVLHLLIDSADGDQIRSVGIFRYLLYTLNFTTLVSGPIQRYEDFSRDQFAPTPIGLSFGDVGLQLERILRGLFKVNVLGVILLAVQQDALLKLPQPLVPHASLAGFTVFVVYPFFLYANFSGYIDIVIALARLMRLRLPENFDRPFSAASFIDFWNRWHITLSSWLKSYVYNPLLLALMRRFSSVSLQPYLGVLCFFATFFLVGVWHGRTSEFVFFGILQGGGVAANKLWQVRLGTVLGRKTYKALASRDLYRAFARGLTFTWFAFTLLWFWASWSEIKLVFHSLPWSAWAAVFLSIWIAATLVLEAWERLRARLLSFAIAGASVFEHRYARMVYATAEGLAAIFVVFLLHQPTPEIVYKTF